MDSGNQPIPEGPDERIRRFSALLTGADAKSSGSERIEYLALSDAME